MLALCDPLNSSTPSDPTRPVRVCFLIDELARAGTETQLLALIRRLDRRRVQPYLCLLRGRSETSQQLEPDDCPVVRLEVDALKHPSTLLKGVRFAQFLRSEKIDILQTYFPDSSYFGTMIGWMAGVSTRVRTRNNIGHWVTPWRRWMGRFLNPFTTLTIANCTAAKESLLRDEHPSPKSVLVLENGVDEERFANIPSLRESDFTTPKILTLANLRPIKGLDLLVRAAKRIVANYPRTQFEVGGEGDQRAELQQSIDESNLTEQFHLRGSIDDVPSTIAQSQIAVLCSRSEGMPNAVLEYMAAGRAIVATKVGAVGEMIEDGVHGLLVPPGDEVRLADAISRLLADPALACRLGAAARQRVREYYTRAAMVHRFENLYAHLAQRSSLPERKAA